MVAYGEIMGYMRMAAYGGIWVENFGRDRRVVEFGGHRPMARRRKTPYAY